MKSSILAILAMALAEFACGSARAQVIDFNVQPNPATDREPVELSAVFPFYPATQTLDWEVVRDGTSIALDIRISGQSGGGVPLIGILIETLDPLAPGTYEVVGNIYLDGALADSDSVTLRVEPIRAVPWRSGPAALIAMALLLVFTAWLRFHAAGPRRR